MARTPEGEIKFAICQYLATVHRDVIFWLNASVGRSGRKNHSKYQRNGTADILGILPGGRMLAIEVKTLEGKLTAEQRDFLSLVNKMGGVAGLCRSVGEVQLLMQEADLNYEDEHGEDN